MRPEHHNHFDTIRLLTAWSVIVAHHYPITGVAAPAWISNQWLNWAWLGGVAVMTFFVISGYLVTLSWMREPRLLPFLWKRVLRLWPGLCGAVLVCIFVFGIAFTSLPAPEFLQSPGVLEFAGNLTSGVGAPQAVSGRRPGSGMVITGAPSVSANSRNASVALCSGRARVCNCTVAGYWMEGKPG